MMKVKMLTHIVGKPSYHTGQVVELDDKIAKAWIADELAVLHRDDAPVERAVRQ